MLNVMPCIRMNIVSMFVKLGEDLGGVYWVAFLHFRTVFPHFRTDFRGYSAKTYHYPATVLRYASIFAFLAFRLTILLRDAQIM